MEFFFSHSRAILDDRIIYFHILSSQFEFRNEINKKFPVSNIQTMLVSVGLLEKNSVSRLLSFVDTSQSTDNSLFHRYLLANNY